MVNFDTYLKAFAAMTCVAFALVVLAGGRRKGAPLYLGLFLLLIAGNQATEVLRGILAAGTAPIDTLLWRVATVFAAFDPLALYLFARAVEPEPRRALAPRAIAIVAGVLAFGSLLLRQSPTLTRVEIAALTLFTAVVYALVAARFLRAVSRDPSERRSRMLFYAAAVVAVLPWIYVIGAFVVIVKDDILGATSVGDPLYRLDRWASALSWPAGLVAIVLVCLLTRRLPNGRETMRVAGIGLLGGLALGGALNATSFTTILRLGEPYDPIPAWWNGVIILGRASASVRWILFGGLVSAVVLREDMLGLSLRHRRRAARALVALAVIGAIVLGYAALAILFGPESVELRPIDWLLIALMFVATQGVRPLIDSVAARAYGVPMRFDRSSAHDAYRRAVVQAAAEGRDVRTDPEIARLRAELDLNPAEAAVMERVAEDRVSGPLVAGQRVGGRYLVRRLVGRGGAGRVFLARDEMLSRDIVLKEVLHDGPDDETALREARAAGSLQHPNVVVVHDVLRRMGSSLLVVEYVPSGSLSDRLAASGPLPLHEGLRLLDGVLCGLEAVHAQGLVHRDLKPDNVLLGTDGTPKIADFGIARARRGMTARFDEPDAFVGTPEFMAPEQRSGARATTATDVYAVGRIARSALAPPLPPEIESVIAKALAEEPSERWPNAGEMRAALSAAMRRVRV